MDLDFNINMNGASDKLGKNLEQSTKTYGEDFAMGVTAGAGNVVASTGINVGVGSTDEIIADNIAAAVNLTGEQGLMNLSNNLEAYAQQLAAMGLNAPEQLVEIILGEITKVLEQGGVIDAIKKGLQVTQNTVELAKIGLNYATSITTIIGNLEKLLLYLNKMQDVDVMCVPTVKDSVRAYSASFINQLKAQYEALKQQLIIFYNSMICTSNDSVLDNIIVSFNNILNVLEPIIDPIMQKYTGHSVQEIRNICNQGFAYIGMIQRAAARKRQQKENEQQEKIKEPEVPKRKLSKEEKEKLKQERREISKKKWEQKTKDLSIEQSREKLLIWLNDQPIMIQNAFLLLIIKDTIDDIKRFISQLQNTSIENQVDLLNTINNILEIFDQLGLTPDAQGITIEDLKKLGMAAAGTIAATAVDIGNQVQQNSDEFTQQYINEVNAKNVKEGTEPLSSNVVADARGTVAAVSNKSQQIAENDTSLSTSEVAEQTAKEVGAEVGASALDQLIQIAINAGLSMDMDAIARGDVPTINTNSFSSSVVENDMFSYSQENSNKDIIINITINKNPSMHLLAINSFIKSFKSGNNKDIFNSAATKQIRDTFKEAWELNETVELEISSIVDGVTKYYKFIIDVNKDARKNPEKYENNDASNNLNVSTNLNISTNLNEPNLSQLTKVDIRIDATLLEQILFDPSTGKHKILIFDEVVQFLKILQPVIQTLRVLAHLLENYIINKEFVREKRHVDVAYALKNAAQLINGLKDIVDLKNTNFFTIRTQEMADWTKSTFTSTEIKDGMMVIGKIDTFIDGLSQITGNNPDTLVLNEYCAVHAIKPEIPLDLLKGTTLYFDKWAIENGGYKDGTLNDLDNIEINNTLGELYYDARQRSTISSEILRARKKKINPNYVKTASIENESKSIEELLNLTKFNSDEMEGQQTLNLCDLNLCPKPSMQEISDNKPQQSAVIIEFGDEYTLGDKVDYNIVVKPGQTIKEGDILAYITKNGVQCPLRTKFTGVVRGIDNYSHLYPSIANRHFVIDDYSPCMPVDYNINDIMEISKRFRISTELGAFILNCMPLSILPILLAYADRNNEVELQFGTTPIPSVTEKSEESFSTYNTLIKNYDKKINELNDQMVQLGSIDNFKPIDSSIVEISEKTYYKVQTNKNEKLKDELLNIRKQMINTAIDTYNQALNIGKHIKGDYIYGDCIGLAFNKELIFTREVDDKKIDNINYFVNILQNIPDSKEQKIQPINIDIADINSKLKEMYTVIDENGNKSEIQSVDASGNIIEKVVSNNPTINGILNSISQLSNNTDENERNYIKEYYELITRLMDERLGYEGLAADTIKIAQFNEYYNYHILENDTYRLQANPFETLKNKLQEQDSLNNKDAILNQIKFDKLGKTFNLSDINEFKEFKKAEDDKSEDDEEYYNVCQHALTMFMYLINSNINTRNKVHKIISSIYVKTEEDKKSLKYIVNDIAQIYVSIDHKISYKEEKYSDFLTLYNAMLDNNKIKYVEEYNKHVKYEKDKIEVEDLTESQLEEIKNNTINEIAKLLNTTTNIINYILDGYDAINDVDTTLDENSLLFFNRKINEKFYTLICKEANAIETFWKEVLAEYNDPNGKYNLDNVIKDMQNYANKMNSYVQWPTPINIKVDNTNYELYTFADKHEDPKKAPTEILVPTDMGNTEMPDPIVDLNNLPEPRDRDNITILDYEYWLVYMLNATLFTLLPQYWADGFDVPPFMTPTLLPALYVPIAPPIMIPVVNVLLVFGIAIRGIWPAPIILMVNLSSNDIDGTVFIRIAMEIAKDIFRKSQELVENGIPMMVKGIIDKYISENQDIQKGLEKFRIYSSIIHAIPVEDKALVERKFNEALVDEMNKQTKLNNNSVKLQKAKDKINETNKDAQTKINNLNAQREEYIQEKEQEYNEFLNSGGQKKVKNSIKKFDRRQVVTREADLGNGPAPM